MIILISIGEDKPKEKVAVPGPGQYAPVDPKKVKEESPSWKMGTSKRETEAKVTKVPGPGSYEPKSQKVSTHILN